MDTLEFLEKYKIVINSEVLDYRSWQNGFYYKIKIYFSDTSILFATEYFDEYKRKYSYHWQNNIGKLVLRWDNTPHHKDILTFPFHKHLSSGIITESFEITLKEVLDLIEKKIEKL